MQAFLVELMLFLVEPNLFLVELMLFLVEPMLFSVETMLFLVEPMLFFQISHKVMEYIRFNRICIERNARKYKGE